MMVSWPNNWFFKSSMMLVLVNLDTWLTVVSGLNVTTKQDI